MNNTMVKHRVAAGDTAQPGIKKTLFGITLLLVTCTNLFAQVTSSTSKAQAILTNGGFENSLNGWSTAAKNGNNAPFTITNDALQVHSGLKGLIIKITDAVNSSVSLSASPVKLKKNGYYLLRFWALATLRNALLDINLKEGNTGNVCHFEIWDRKDTTSNQWQMYQYAFKATGGNAILQFNFNTATNYYLDDVEIVNDETNPELDVRAQYDWQNNFNETYGWLSGDNNNPVLLPDNRVAWVYNDSFMGPEDPHTNVLHSPRMINNLVVVQKGDSLVSLYGGNAQRPSSLFVPANNKSEFWQSGGVVENGMLKIVLIEITRKGISFAGHTWIGAMSLPDLRVVSLHQLPATLKSSPNCVMQDGDYDYLYLDTQRSTVVGRVPKGQLDSQTAWEFYTGNGNWSTDFTQAVQLVENVAAGNVIKIGPGNYAMSGVPNLSGEVAVWFAQSPVGPWVSKTIIYRIPREEGLLAYEGHVNPLGNKGVYTFTYSLYPFIKNPVAMQFADKTTYVPCFVKANLPELSPFTNRTTK
jgi:hypothetical protein